MVNPDRNGSELLRVESITAGYRRRAVVWDLSMTVRAGEIVVVIGHNGAGKTTTLKTIFGLVRPLDGKVTYRGADVSHTSCARHVELGMSFTLAEHFVFPNLPVAVNLRLGALGAREKDGREQRLAAVHEMFPILRTRAGQLAGTLSGGEQRLLGLGMALMSNPKMLLIDEPSLGVSPAFVQRILAALRDLVTVSGCSVLMVEQNVGYAVREADRVYVMRSGRVILEESGSDMRQREHWWDLF